MTGVTEPPLMPPKRSPAIVVTGGSDGIGRALAAEFARPRQTLVLMGRDLERLAAAKIELEATPNVRVLTLRLDLIAPNALSTLKAFLNAEQLWIETLINSAGIGSAGPFADETPEKIDDLVAINIAALTKLTRFALDHMRAEGRGTIINLSSLGAYAPGPNQAVYYASKAYVLSLTEALAHEVKSQGIRVMAVVPGPVRTNFHARMGARSAWYLRLMPVPQPAVIARYVAIAHALGFRVIAPGLLTVALIPAMKIMPHRLLLPMIGFLLAPRR